MANHKMKKIGKSIRGLTFTLSKKEAEIGTKFRYVVDSTRKQIMIFPDPSGTSTVSRKRVGHEFKPLYDIRSKEVKDLCRSAEYLEIEVLSDKIIVHTFQKANSVSQDNKIINIEQLIGKRTGEIVICKAAGSEWDFGRPTLANDIYFENLCRLIPSNLKPGFKKKWAEVQSVYDVVSLFSGAGLLDYSFRDPQFRFVYALDFDKDACETYRHNIGNHIICKDIREVEEKSVPNSDLVLAGTCCYGYSNANRQDIEKESGRQKRLLIDDCIRLILHSKPKVFVIENVPQFYSKEKGLYINKVLEGLSEYEITCNMVTDCELGGFTRRKMAIVIGSRIGKISLPSVKFSCRNTVRDALSKVDTEWFNYNDVTNPRECTALAMSFVKPEGNWKDIPQAIHKFGKNTHSDRFRRLAWDEIAPTIVNWRKICMMPPEGNRILSVAEAAALMGLDKNFCIHGSNLGSKQQQIGNGVTQAIGRFIKKYVLDALNKHTNILQPSF